MPASSSPFYQNTVGWFRDFPVLYKILIANSILVVIATGLGSWLLIGHGSSQDGHSFHWTFTMWFGGVTLAALIIVNYFVLRAALQPLTVLTRLSSALRRGEMSARAHRPLFGDSKLNRTIETVNALLDDLTEYKGQIDETSKRAMNQLETERRNIARELHDETAQNLATLLVLEQMIAQAKSDDERMRSIEDTRQLTRLTLEGVRRMSIGLRPAILDDVGIRGALRWYVEEVLSNVLPETTLHLEDSIDEIEALSELALYRIAQETLSNVARHSEASKVSVSLAKDGDAAVLRIADNGVGFDVRAPSKNHREHLGLFTIRERARLGGGEAEITSQPDKGTEVMARLPIRNSEST